MKVIPAIFALLLLSSTPLAVAQAPLPVPAPQPSMQPAPTPPPPSITGSAWLLMDYATGQVLAGENIDTRVEPASITKVMTSYVAAAELKAGKISAADLVTISENAWRSGGAGTDGSTSFMPLGSQVKFDDLLHGMIVQSGNDASIAIAEHVAGSEEAFAALMNQYAQRLGMTGSHFVNAHGLSNAKHYSTARDIAVMSQALIRDFPDEYAYYKLKEYTFNNIRQHNRNSLLWRDASIDGIKTGHHSGAGYCLATSALRDDQRLISVVMGSTSEKLRADDSQALLNWGFRFYETHTLYAAAAQVAEVKLWKGKSDTVALGLVTPLRITLPRGRYNDLKPSMDVPAQLLAPVGKGQRVGTLRVSLDDNVLVERPLVALDDIAEGGLFKRLNDGFWMWWEAD
ncbi:MAG: D-alanyl-D-alanine carboxypeptidase family protein [Xanthomonadaceae bacterium]|nr:D-alanyl-D-alanine carboxypeptidase family protein [Xanthomonadaceae bacterium]MDP2186075.1 D-alanyl-D-alanine carboxypeptidase family protein [Xanthomonadales bacterium]MDZ4117470.1 D-alanyl-D-alanine carboxypeptidase family protein [Xanthomonadaceae bacterium]MDZ4378955.1 D-alanyl-D-alanine carboxypeptidase family protein [Xanthomonadaceae bacterium]